LAQHADAQAANVAGEVDRREARLAMQRAASAMVGARLRASFASRLRWS
jgi:hypothetical protein